MRPFTVLIGIVLGSAASITFGLGAVLLVFFVLMGEHPDLSREMPRLAGSLAVFAILTTASRGVVGRISLRGFPYASWSCCIGRAAIDRQNEQLCDNLSVCWWFWRSPH
jgi:hypothetical protein